VERQYQKPANPATHSFVNTRARVSKARCSGCRFFLPNPVYEWDTPETRSTRGECRRHAPQIGHGDYGRGGGFPTTDRTDWCGEFDALNWRKKTPPRWRSRAGWNS